jgi:hypothetical protein
LKQITAAIKIDGSAYKIANQTLDRFSTDEPQSEEWDPSRNPRRALAAGARSRTSHNPRRIGRIDERESPLCSSMEEKPSIENI